MHDVVLRASQALTYNDADALEQLALEARGAGPIASEEVRQVAKACVVLSALVEAAATQLALRSRVHATTQSMGAARWER